MCHSACSQILYWQSYPAHNAQCTDTYISIKSKGLRTTKTEMSQWTYFNNTGKISYIKY
jgi:hypothetical protein